MREMREHLPILPGFISGLLSFGKSTNIRKTMKFANNSRKSKKIQKSREICGNLEIQANEI